MSSLRGGGLSVVFHAPFDEADNAFQVHALQGAKVRLEIFMEVD